MTDPKNPARLADDAAEAIRGLNHATFAVGNLDWEHPADAYSVIGGLDRMAGGLEQALTQVSRLLYELHTAGHVTSDHGQHAAAAEVLTARTELRAARIAADQMRQALGRAHSATSPLAYRDSRDA